ncbi:class I SAM-dependent methyltransferase [Nodosilinea sp. PGN35]|uniref:class I SAM-dependent methyltransferase n=1 Tax=Nodosilinea sp. PGN35 TaxID=3020489 RepID=UPI0023B2343A|nr:methyltransferase domain-containing protein [Nodosilinea sp. TSF1-S3]MDF0367609.1 methyltransferase domain-containing protein [Nodosilinea sp. TSF1-S3]
MLKKLSLALKHRLLPILKGLIPDGWRLVPTEGFELVPTDQFDLVPRGQYDYVPKGTYVFGPMDRFVLMPKNRYRAVLLPGQTVSSELGVGWVTEANSPAGYDLLWGDSDNLAAFRAEADHVRDKLTVEIADVVEKNLHSQAAVVDIGCGVGDLLVEMRRRQGDITVAGLDFSPRAVEGALAALPDGSFMQFVIEKHLPYETDAFDVVLCTDVLEHLEYPQAIAAELVRICRPGGSVFIVVPDGDVDLFLGHYWFWNQATLQTLLAEWRPEVARLPITREFIAHISV